MKKGLGIFLIAIGVFFILGFVGNFRIMLGMFENSSIDGFSKNNFITIVASFLIAGLIFVFRGVKWCSKSYNPKYFYGLTKVIFGNLFYIISYFTLLTFIVTALEYYYKGYKIMTPIVFLIITFFLFRLAKKWTKKKEVLEIDKIGEE